MVRLYFLALIVGTIIFGLSGSILAWDGSYLLYRIISTDTPYIIHLRYITIPAHWLALFVSQLTDNFYFIQLAFGALYISVPLFSSVLSWLIVRRERPQLFVWCAISTGLTTILGQYFLVSEGMFIIHLFWPLWFSVLLGGKSWRILVIIGFAILFPFTHPYAIGLLTYALLAWVVIHYRQQLLSSRKFWFISVGLVIATLASIYFLTLDTNPFVQAESLSGRLILTAIYRLHPLAMLNLGLVGILSIALFVWNQRYRQGTVNVSDRLSWLIIGISIACGIILFIWASNAGAWWNGLTYRSASVFIVSPIYFLAFIDVIRSDDSENDSTWDEWHVHKMVIMISGIIFAGVAITQSLVWVNITTRVQSVLEQNSTACIPTQVIEDTLGQTMFTHWSAVPYFLILQGQNPEYILQDEANCSPDVLAEGIYVTEWDHYLWDNDVNWFNLDNLQPILTE